MVGRLFLNDRLTGLFEGTVGKLVDFVRLQRGKAIDSTVTTYWLPAIQSANAGFGPFSHTRRKSVKAYGSALYPKLTGTYESELHETIEIACQRQYDVIVDIGCAEGFYAVGLALRIPDTSILAYDITSNARDACRELAVANNVAERIAVLPYCDSAELDRHCRGRRCLIICDCEGYERFLFNETAAEACAHSDLIIEVHDFVCEHTGSHLMAVFDKTHVCQRVDAVPWQDKVGLLPPAVATTLSKSFLRAILDEYRPPGMYWLVFQPRLQNDEAARDR